MPMLVGHHGPFLGLRLDLAPQQIGPQYAVQADNVLLTEGRIRPRGSWRKYAPIADPNQHIGAQALAMLDWDRCSALAEANPQHSDDPSWRHQLIWAQRQSGRIYATNIAGEAVEVGLGGTYGNPYRPPCFVVANGMVYVCVGEAYTPQKLNGEPDGAVLVGLPVPTLANAVYANGELVTPPTTGVVGLPQIFTDIYADPNQEQIVQYAVTFYDEVHDVESNPLILPALDRGTPTAWTAFRIDFFPNLGVPYGFAKAITHLRVYRRHQIEGFWGSPGYRLWVGNLDESGAAEGIMVQIPIGYLSDPPQGGEYLEWFDVVNEAALDMGGQSSSITGPWAPSRNGIPPMASVAYYYKDRMFYNEISDGNKVWYSEVGHPDHVADDAYLTVGSETNDAVTGFGELAGQLVILKERSMWMLAGNIYGPTNATAATGTLPQESTVELFRVKTPVGCANAVGANGAVVAGDPPLVFFNAPDGLYVFDGVSPKCVSRPLGRLWDEFARGSVFASVHKQQVSYACDPQQKVLYVAQPGLNWFLAYHYGLDQLQGVGGWSRVISETGNVFSIATGLGARVQETQAPGDAAVLLVSLEDCAYLQDQWAPTDDSEQLPPPYWVWKTGTLRVGPEGHSAHLQGIRWFTGRPGKSPHCLRLGFNDPQRSVTVQTEYRVERQVGIIRQPVERVQEEIALLAERGTFGGQEWDPNHGILGFEIEGDVVGQR